MNIISLNNFYREINQISEYLKHIKYVNDVANCDVQETENEQIRSLQINLKEHYRSFGTDKKVFEYKATVISLYGLLEKYVEIWIKEFLDSLSNLIPLYDTIDERIKNNHFELSLKLINTISSRETAKYQHLKKEIILEKLHICIKNPTNYKFNTEAFVLLSGNLKHNKIVELFKLININLNDELKKNKAFIKNIQKEQHIKDIVNLKTDTLYNKINDLVDRRNTIAHGSEVIDDLLDNSVLQSYIEYLENYCQAVFEILNEEIIKLESIHNYFKIDVVHNVWKSSIVGFEIENYKIVVGDFLIVESTDGSFFKKPILQICINTTTYLDLEVKDKTNVAIRIEPPISCKQKFYLLKKVL